MTTETATSEPASDDVKRALLRHEQQKEAEKIRQETAIQAEVKKIKSGETKYNYVAIFETEAGQDILDDLKEFCFYDKPLYDDDQREMFRNVVKNEVIHYILEQIGEVNIITKPTPSPLPTVETIIEEMIQDAPIPERAELDEHWLKTYKNKMINLFKPKKDK